MSEVIKYRNKNNRIVLKNIFKVTYLDMKFQYSENNSS